MQAPVIETGRLRLRGHATTDLEPMAAMWAEEDVTRFTTGVATGIGDTWVRCCATPAIGR